jgi:glutathione S-transferase
VFVDFFKGETRSDAYRANVNEMGEAPVLVHGDVRLSQSGVILTYLAERSGRFGGETDEQRREALRWILFDNHKFTSYVATYRFLRAFAKAGDPAVHAFLKGRIESAFKIVEKHLTIRAYVLGAKPSIADFSMCGYLYYPPEELGFDIAADYPAVAAWLDRIKALPGWEHPYKLMPGHPLAS